MSCILKVVYSLKLRSHKCELIGPEKPVIYHQLGNKLIFDKM